MNGEEGEKSLSVEAQPGTGLLPLTPQFDETSHRLYVDAIEQALTKKQSIRNIALTGGYGVGKSSILAKIVDLHDGDVAQVSLSTLGLPDGDGGGETSPTNRIQKEIVKQLLYREVPVRMAGSRFRRIGQFAFWRGVGLAALGGFAVALVFFLTGWTASLAGLFKPLFDIGGYFNLITFAVFALGVYGLLVLSHNRVAIKGFTIAKTDITLASPDTTFFDQYLDEIVYFFDVTKRTIVVFEDIDRFDDPHIFETLRALNTLLNGAKQLKGRSIRFIYAIKDSIFEELGDRVAGEAEGAATDAVAAEVARANRTKFFDLVIPVVPFITRGNASELIGRVMNATGYSISADLIALAARYVPDMRLITNVRNEFLIFRQKVMRAGDGGELALTDDALFAMMLYKSTHLSDFELIRTGTSKLDTLYGASTRLVAHNLRELNGEATTIRQELRSLDAAEERSAVLGPALLRFIGQMRGRLGQPANIAATISLAGTAYTEADLSTADFWRAFAEADNQLNISLQGRVQFSVTKDDASEILGDSLSPADWDESERGSREGRLTEIQTTRDFLSHANLMELAEHDEYLGADGEPFRTHVNKLDSPLARQLVTGGYIDRYYALYTTPFYAGSVSTRAQNFLMQNVDRVEMDVNFVLTADDVDAVLKQRGAGVLGERSMFNVAVADRVVALGGEQRERLMRALAAATESDRSVFLDAYFADGAEPGKLTTALTNVWSDILPFLVSPDRSLDAQQHARLLNAALVGLAARRTYALDDAVRQDLESNYRDLPVLTSDDTRPAVAQRIAGLLAHGSVRLPDIAPLGAGVREAVVATDAFVLNKTNLVAAAGSADELSLDQLRQAHKSVYDFVLRDLSAYLSIRGEEGGFPTVSKTDALGPVVADVVQIDPGHLQDVLAAAVAGAEVAQLVAVPPEAWPELAARGQFPLTFENVSAYIESVGSIDGPLAAQLEARGAVVVSEDVDQSEREELAKLVLAAQTAIPDPATRVDLVVSLDLTDWLAPGDIPAESGPLIGLLIEREVIQDTATSFALATAQDWPTREAAIARSTEFVNFMTPTEVPLADVPALLRSQAVPEAVKAAVVARADEFVPTNQNAALTAVASYALAHSIALPLDLIARMAAVRVAATNVVQLLGPLLSSITLAQLAPILVTLGGDYALAAARGTKHPKLSDTPANRTLLDRLQVLGIVSTYKISRGGLTVNLRKP